MATGKGGNETVKSELEAAQALAGLVSSESPTQHYSVFNCTNSLRLSSGSADEGVAVPRQYENTCNVALNKGNVAQDGQLHKTIATCSRIHTYTNGTTSRHKLTEEEKEARRMRRISANRESARQTIYRRQEMDFAENEYKSLKSTNESLKYQMVKAFSTKLDESRTDLTSMNAEMCKTTCPSFPFMVYNQTPPFPCIRPAFIQHPNTTQASCENKNVPNHPLYILSCPIFYPVPNYEDGFPLVSHFDLRNNQIATPMSYSYAFSSSTKTAEYGFNESKGEADSTWKNIQEVPFKIQTGPPLLVKPKPSVKPLTCQLPEFVSTSCNIDLNICPSKKQDDDVAAPEARMRRKELTKLRSIHLRDFGRG